MAKVSNYIKNSDYDSSFQQQSSITRVTIPAGHLEDGQVLRSTISVPRGVYISDVAMKTNLINDWWVGALEVIYESGGWQMGDVTMYGYLRRTGLTTYSAEVYIDIFGGGTSTVTLPRIDIDFMCVFSELPV